MQTHELQTFCNNANFSTQMEDIQQMASRAQGHINNRGKKVIVVSNERNQTTYKGNAAFLELNDKIEADKGQNPSRWETGKGLILSVRMSAIENQINGEIEDLGKNRKYSLTNLLFKIRETFHHYFPDFSKKHGI